VSTQLAYEVLMFEAKPNKMFPDWLTARVRFLRFRKAVVCAECGRKRKHHWTLLCAFQAHTMAKFIPAKSGKVHAPLTAVCRDHLLAPEIVETETAPI
jgi:hypothetical protein